MSGRAGHPNVLIIVADQLRAPALGCGGDANVKSPHFDRLAAEGVMAANSFSTDPVCTPARAALLTGRYPHTVGMMVNHVRLSEKEVTFAHVLRDRGYATGYIGKWHLDGDGKPGFVPPGPRRQGFDYWAGFNRGHDYWTSTYYRDTDEPIQPGGYEPDYQTDLALEFIRTHHRSPFCLMLSWGPPHTPLNPPDDYRAQYDPARMTLRPNVPHDGAARVRADLTGYYGHISALDTHLGRLLAELDRTGIAGNTLVVLTSDHGDMLGSHGLTGKRWPYEESVRVPLLFRWPGGLPAGRVTEVLASSVDFAPTLLSLSGAAVPSAAQGRDLAPWIRGDDGGGLGPEAVYLEGMLDHPDAVPPERRREAPSEWRAIRTHRHLLAVDLAGRPVYLFDLQADPYQQENLARSPEARHVLDGLLRELHARARSAGDTALRAQA